MGKQTKCTFFIAYFVKVEIKKRAFFVEEVQRLLAPTKAMWTHLMLHLNAPLCDDILASFMGLISC